MKTGDPMEYARRKLRVSYLPGADTLEVHNGEQVRYRYTVADGLTANLDADCEAAGFTLEKAQELLLPHLKEYDAASVKRGLNYLPVAVLQESSIENNCKMLGRNPRNTLNIGYSQNHDTLDMWNEQGASFGWDVGANLVAFSMDENGQELHGFTLECAAQLLLPCFLQSVPEPDKS